LFWLENLVYAAFLRLPVTVWGFARERIFSTTFDTKPNVQIYEKVSYEALSPLSCKTLVPVAQLKYK